MRACTRKAASPTTGGHGLRCRDGRATNRRHDGGDRVPRRFAHLRRGARLWTVWSSAVELGEFFLAMLGPSARARPPACAWWRTTPTSGMVLLYADVCRGAAVRTQRQHELQDYMLFPHDGAGERHVSRRVSAASRKSERNSARGKCSSWCSWARRANGGRRSSPAARERVALGACSSIVPSVAADEPLGALNPKPPRGNADRAQEPSQKLGITFVPT